MAKRPNGLGGAGRWQARPTVDGHLLTLYAAKPRPERSPVGALGAGADD